jgi:hypothetical protein
MSLFSFLGGVPHSTDLPSSLGDLGIEISIEDQTERGADTPDYTRQSITAVLRNARGDEIERGDVGVEVNGVPLDFRVGTGNYYDRHPYYRLGDDAHVRIAPATDYHFVLILPDGARHEVGMVRTPAALTAAQFDFQKRRPASGEVVLGWHDLTEAMVLTLFRSDIVRESDGARVLESGSANDPDSLRWDIGPTWWRRSSDRLTIPTAFLANKGNRALRTLGAEILIVHESRVAKTFAKGSMMRAERRLTLRMEWAENE